MNLNRLSLILIATLSLGGLSPVTAQDLVADGEEVFKKCRSCHAVGEDARNKVGPVLNDLFGRAAATVDGFRYSNAMTEKGTEGLVWTPEIFDEYITDPRAYVPGTKMAYRGLPDADDRTALIAYLLTFSPDFIVEEEPAE